MTFSPTTLATPTVTCRSPFTFSNEVNADLAYKAQVYGSAYLNKLGGVTYTNGVQVLLQ
ncbi:MAG: hypothetical protein ACI89E_000589 [Planctomycetota bacterium]|jgi:hypothetical protein